MYPQTSGNSSGTTGTPVFDPHAVRNWLELLHASSDGLIHISSTGNWSGAVFPASDFDSAVQYVTMLDRGKPEGIYLRTTSLADTPADGGRGSAAESCHLPGFALDIDLAGPGHKTTRPLPTSYEDVLHILSSVGLPEPTCWVHSGGGVYPWWMFEQPVDITDPEDRELAEHVVRGLQALVKDALDRAGLHFGTGVIDLARVLRLPGTINRKEGLARPCRVIDPASYVFHDYNAFAGDILAKASQLIAANTPAASRAPRPIQVSDDMRPGDAMELSWGWEDILAHHGWYRLRRMGRGWAWRRPGKEGTGLSATTGMAADRDRLFVFSTEASPFDCSFDVGPYTKFAAYTLLEHNGNFSAAGAALRKAGFGGQRNAQVHQPANPAGLVRPADGGGAGTEVELAGPQQVDAVEKVTPVKAALVLGHSGLPMSDVGNGMRMKHFYGEKFRYHTAEKDWYQWNGRIWERDETLAVERAAVEVTQQMLAEAYELGADEGKSLRKHALSSQSNSKILGMVARFRAQEGVSAGPSSFDANRDLITLTNGVLNLTTKELTGFDPDTLLTRQFHATYDPSATCPQFHAFLAKLLPDAGVREYLKRAMGYTLAGRVDHRSIFVMYGPPRTGKSQFLNIMRAMFGTFGGTAAAAALRVNKNASTNDLHGLRGKRFISTSETSHSTTLDEEVIKRLTGDDAVVSRNLYEKNQEWSPECTIWMATNTKPRLSADDPAIWTRVKPILFATQFSADENATNKEVPKIWEKIFRAEADGILNWLLEGMDGYLSEGLTEPQSVVESVAEYKLECDSVAQFLVDGADEAMIAMDVTERIDSAQLYRIYEEWCNQNGTRRVGAQKFSRRMQDLGWQRVKNGRWLWAGIKIGLRGVLGTM